MKLITSNVNVSVVSQKRTLAAIKKINTFTLTFNLMESFCYRHFAQSACCAISNKLKLETKL
jgi:hypothetical protein